MEAIKFWIDVQEEGSSVLMASGFICQKQPVLRENAKNKRRMANLDILQIPCTFHFMQHVSTLPRANLVMQGLGFLSWSMIHWL